MNRIFDVIISCLGGKYKVIKSFEADQELDLNGVFAVNITNIQHLHHGNTKDRKYSVSINGQTITEQDKDRKNINDMFDYISGLNFQSLVNLLDDCAGVVTNSGTITSDGETNNFSYEIDLYICED